MDIETVTYFFESNISIHYEAAIKSILLEKKEKCEGKNIQLQIVFQYSSNVVYDSNEYVELFNNILQFVIDFKLESIKFQINYTDFSMNGYQQKFLFKFDILNLEEKQFNFYIAFKNVIFGQENQIKNIFRDGMIGLNNKFIGIQFQHLVLDIRFYEQDFQYYIEKEYNFNSLIYEWIGKYSITVTEKFTLNIDIQEEKQLNKQHIKIFIQIFPQEEIQSSKQLNTLLKKVKHLQLILNQHYFQQFSCLQSSLLEIKDQLESVVILETFLTSCNIDQYLYQQEYLSSGNSNILIFQKNEIDENQMDNFKNSLYEFIVQIYLPEINKQKVSAFKQSQSDILTLYQQRKRKQKLQLYITNSTRQNMIVTYLQFVKKFKMEQQQIENICINDNLELTKYIFQNREIFSLSNIILSFSNNGKLNFILIYYSMFNTYYNIFFFKKKGLQSVNQFIKLLQFEKISNIYIKESLVNNKVQEFQNTLFFNICKLYSKYPQYKNNLLEFNYRLQFDKDSNMIPFNTFEITNSLQYVINHYYDQFDFKFYQIEGKFFNFQQYLMNKSQNSDSLDQCLSCINNYDQFVNFLIDTQKYELFISPKEILDKKTQNSFKQTVQIFQQNHNNVYIYWKILHFDLPSEKLEFQVTKNDVKTVKNILQIIRENNIIVEKLCINLKEINWKQELYEQMIQEVIQLYNMKKIITMIIQFHDGYNFLYNNSIKFYFDVVKIKINNINQNDLDNKLKFLDCIFNQNNINKRIQNLKISVSDRYKSYLKISQTSTIYQQKLTLCKILARLKYLKSNRIKFFIWYKIYEDDYEDTISNTTLHQMVTTDIKKYQYQKFYNVDCIQQLQEYFQIQQKQILILKTLEQQKSNSGISIKNMFRIDIIQELLQTMQVKDCSEFQEKDNFIPQQEIEDLEEEYDNQNLGDFWQEESSDDEEVSQARTEGNLFGLKFQEQIDQFDIQQSYDLQQIYFQKHSYSEFIQDEQIVDFDNIDQNQYSDYSDTEYY